MVGAQPEKGAAALRRWPSGHLRPQRTQRRALSLQLATVQQFLLGQAVHLGDSAKSALESHGPVASPLGRRPMPYGAVCKAQGGISGAALGCGVALPVATRANA
jgi:hypothetical protein